MRRLAFIAALAAALLAGSSAHALRLPSARHCPVFPTSNAWNQHIDKLPVAADSARLIASIGLDAPVHADFGSGKWDGGPIGIPFDVVSRTTPLHRVSFQYADESDKGPYPIPRHTKIEYGSDHHALMVDRSSCKLYEVYALRGKHAGSGAIWSLRSNKLRPPGWTSADAAGLPIFPGLARWDEVKRGRINHALRFTVENTRRAYIYPARHYASNSNNPDYPPTGLRVRLKADVDISHFPRQARVVLRALQRYGMILADNGSPWYVSGAPSPRWNNDALHTLGRLTGADFEVVDTSSLPQPGK